MQKESTDYGYHKNMNKRVQMYKENLERQKHKNLLKETKGATCTSFISAALPPGQGKCYGVTNDPLC